MDGIEKITGRINADIQQEIDALTAAAQKEAAAIAAQYREQAERESAEIVERGRKSAAEREERLAGVAQLECRKLELAAKQGMIQKDRTRYGKQAVTAANEALGGKGNLTLSQESRPIKGGLILSDGDVEVNCTFETLVRLQRGELEREVAKVLFDEKG